MGLAYKDQTEDEYCEDLSVSCNPSQQNTIEITVVANTIPSQQPNLGAAQSFESVTGEVVVELELELEFESASATAEQADDK